MPYIAAKDRPAYDDLIKELANKIPQDPAIRCGHLNYIITTLMLTVYNSKAMKYADHNELIGMLECCKQEWYRHLTSLYEEKKISENGNTTVL